MKWVDRLFEFSVARPRLVLALSILITLAFGALFPLARIDTDPENMLRRNQPDRVFYDQIKQDFAFHDLIVVGIVDPEGVYRVPALERIARVVDEILAIPGVLTEDLVSLRTTNNATAAGGVVDIRPIMHTVPSDAAGVAALRAAVTSNPFLHEKLVSADGRATAIYVPIQSKTQSRRISEEIRAVLDRTLLPGQKAYVAGLPVAEDTFGHEMFVQMAVIAPIAFACILLIVFVLFRQMSFLLPVALTALMAVVWTMGALIATGQTVHIMASMIPVFLMPISILDDIHVLSEFHERFRATGDRRRAILDSLRYLRRPMFFTSATTVVGFASLATCPIPPVQAHGIFVAFGVAVAWLLTQTVVPAVLVLSRGKPLAAGRTLEGGKAADLLDSVVHALGTFGFRRARILLVAAAALLILAFVGMSRIYVDDNPVRWFRPGHPLRIADQVMNEKFGGTYMAYLIVEGREPAALHDPAVVRYLERVQRHLERDPAVGKTSSVADIVKQLNLVLHDNDPARRTVPPTPEEVGQALFIFQGSAQPGEMDSFMDRDSRRANVWVQMKSGENRDMERVERELTAFLAAEPPPQPLAFRWSGLNHINLVWQGLMVTGMAQAVASSFLFVLGLMVLEFRSWKIGLLAMIPLTVAIAVSYGALGLLGKPYDMPIAVCSSLSLGLAVDFAIHFFERFREHWRGTRDLEETNRYLAGPPGRGIARNAVVISLGFLPLALSSLTPYLTVSVFFGVLMISSALATLILLPAVVRVGGARVLAGLVLALGLSAAVAAPTWAGAAPGKAAKAAPARGAAQAAGTSARAAQPADGTEIMARMIRAYYYPGSGVRAKVVMRLGRAGRDGGERVMSMLRLTTSESGEQKYLLYFHKPGDVRRMSCMVYKHVDLPDERWMYVPLTGSVVKVQAPDRSSFLGSDFMREELSGRDVGADKHTFLREEAIEGRACHVVESRPREPADFTRYVTWVDRETSLPLKQEYYDIRGKLARLFTGARIERWPSRKSPSTTYPTLMERTMRNLTSGRWTSVVLDSVVYDPDVKAADFSPGRMKTPIQKWLPSSPGRPDLARRSPSPTP